MFHLFRRTTLEYSGTVTSRPLNGDDRHITDNERSAPQKGHVSTQLMTAHFVVSRAPTHLPMELWVAVSNAVVLLAERTQEAHGRTQSRLASSDQHTTREHVNTNGNKKLDGGGW